MDCISPSAELPPLRSQTTGIVKLTGRSRSEDRVSSVGGHGATFLSHQNALPISTLTTIAFSMADSAVLSFTTKGTRVSTVIFNRSTHCLLNDLSRFTGISVSTVYDRIPDSLNDLTSEARLNPITGLFILDLLTNFRGCSFSFTSPEDSADSTVAF